VVVRLRRVEEGIRHRHPAPAGQRVRAQQVLRSAQDPNDVIVSHTFDSSEAAHHFMAKPEIRDAMKRAA
jgi:hypothetical protein